MSTKDRDEQHMIRLRKRAEMQPSDDEEEEDSSGGDDGGRSVEVSSGGEVSNSDSDDWEEEEEHGEGPNAIKTFQGSQDHTPDPTDGDQALAIGKRLEMLAHGAGPSRRRRHLQPAGKEGRNPANGTNATNSTTINSTRNSATILSKPQHRDRHRDRKQSGAAASEEAEKGGESSSKQLARTKVHSRANKNRPQEVSSSRAVGRFREVVAGKRKTSRDPRFEGGGGSSKLNYDIFRKAYGFLGTYQDSEIEELKKSFKKEKNQERSGRLQALLTRLQQERAERSQGDRRRTAIREAKKIEREAVADGKKPYYLKGSEKKRLSLEQRYEGLKEEGKLTKFMEKKRKKNAAKDHRWLPAKRQDRG